MFKKNAPGPGCLEKIIQRRGCLKKCTKTECFKKMSRTCMF